MAATLMAGVAPRLGRGTDRAKTLVFVGVADLSVLDPVITVALGWAFLNVVALLAFAYRDSGLEQIANSSR